MAQPGRAGNADEVELGRRIRGARRERGRSLREIAEVAGVSESFLSQVERGVASPSVQSLRRIAAALSVPVVTLLAGPESSGRVVRAGERRRMLDRRGHWVDEFLTPISARRLQVNMTLIEPGFGEPEPYTHNSDEECVVVLEGRLEFETDGERYDLAEGDALLLDPRLPHAFTNPGPDQCRVLWVMTPPSW